MARAPSKYRMVRSALLDLVTGQEVGSAIPPERQLADELGVSRVTLRQVIRDLVDEGFLTPRQGSGTFVSRPKIAQSLTMTSFSEDMRRRGLTPSARTLSLDRVPAGPDAGRWLEVPSQETIVCARRLRLADAEPLAVETLHVPDSMVPGLSPGDLERFSFYELLDDRFGIILEEGRQTIEATVLNQDDAEVLRAPVRSPAFFFERVTPDTSGRPVEYVRSLYRGDRYQLVSMLRPSLSALDSALVPTLRHLPPTRVAASSTAGASQPV